MRHISLAFVILVLSFRTAPAKARKGPPPTSPIAKDVFGAQKLPSPALRAPIGSYAKGCIAGAKPLPIDGPAWEVMRLSRNRNWGHPVLVNLLERLAKDAKTDGWPGLLIGDMAQPMGGPMLSGHASHQIGLDVDIWLDADAGEAPDAGGTRNAVEAVSVLAHDGVSVERSNWTPEYEIS